MDRFPTVLTCSLLYAGALAACAERPVPTDPRVVAAVRQGEPHVPDADAIARGRQIFRHESWGDERFWTDTLRLHEVIQAAVSPAIALAVGLKVDAERLPPGFLAQADLTGLATTVELLRRDAVLGLRAKVTARGELRELGTT